MLSPCGQGLKLLYLFRDRGLACVLQRCNGQFKILGGIRIPHCKYPRKPINYFQMFEQQNSPSTFDEKVSIDSQRAIKNESSQRKKILFLTSSEYGQANVILAVAYELLLRQEYEIHIASFAPLQRRIDDLNALISKNAIPATFHTIAGPSLSQCLEQKDEFIGPYPPGIRGALKTYRVTLPSMPTAYNEEQYIAGYESCLEILRSVKPDFIVVEPMLDQGLDACKKLSRTYMVLSPNTFQELLRYKQPKHKILCRNPA